MHVCCCVRSLCAFPFGMFQLEALDLDLDLELSEGLFSYFQLRIQIDNDAYRKSDSKTVPPTKFITASEFRSRSPRI